MELLRNQADRAIARHMLGMMALILAVGFIGFTGIELLSAGEHLGATIESIEVAR